TCLVQRDSVRRLERVGMRKVYLELPDSILGVGRFDWNVCRAPPVLECADERIHRTQCLNAVRRRRFARLRQSNLAVTATTQQVELQLVTNREIEPQSVRLVDDPLQQRPRRD